MIYTFIEYDPEDTYESQDEALHVLLSQCEYIVTNYGTMYPSEGAKVNFGHRGPQVLNEDGFDWYYNIKGGYSK